MTIQARMSEHDKRLYNINRDVAHNFADVMREIADRLEDERWPILKKICEEHGITQDQLGQACEAYCIFVASAGDKDHKRMADCLAFSGWDKVPDVAQLALMGILGTVMTGLYWTGVREASVMGDGPCLTSQDLIVKGRLAHKLLTMNRWQRWRYRLVTRWRAIRAVLSGRPLADTLKE